MSSVKIVFYSILLNFSLCLHCGEDMHAENRTNLDENISWRLTSFYFMFLYCDTGYGTITILSEIAFSELLNAWMTSSHSKWVSKSANFKPFFLMHRSRDDIRLSIIHTKKKLLWFDYYLWRKVSNLLVFSVYFHNVAQKHLVHWDSIRVWDWKEGEGEKKERKSSTTNERQTTQEKNNIVGFVILFTQKNTWSVSRLCKFFIKGYFQQEDEYKKGFSIFKAEQHQCTVKNSNKKWEFQIPSSS